MSDFKFTILMPAYNAQNYICEAIDSVVNQTYKNWELIIIDDGSTDRTPVIIDEYAKKENRIKIIHQTNSGTAAAARNAGLKIATGDYSQMLDSDDILENTLLQSYYDLLLENDVDIIIPVLESFTDKNEILYTKNPPFNNFGVILDGKEAFKLSLDWQIHGCFLVNMNILKEIKYDPKLINGDEFTTRKLFYNSRKITFSDKKYRYRNNQLSTTKSVSNEAKMYECLITDLNIYNYSLDNNMSKDIIKMCYTKLITALTHDTIKYKNRKIVYTFDNKVFIESIIKKVFYSIKDKKLCYSLNNKHVLIYFLSFKSYFVFNCLCSLLAYMKSVFRLLKGRRYE